MGHGWGIGGLILDVAVMVAVWGLALWAVISVASGSSEREPARKVKGVLADRSVRGEISSDD